VRPWRETAQARAVCYDAKIHVAVPRSARALGGRRGQ